MERRKFISKGLAAGAILPATYATLLSPDAQAAENNSKSEAEANKMAKEDGIIIERSVSGRPHEGKVLAVIQPHVDDSTLFAGGTIAKLISEGYTGYLIRTTNDDAAGGGTDGDRVLNNERDNDKVAKVLGLKKVYNLGYRNHRMDEYNTQEIKGRLIFLFRLLKVDTIFSYDPWGHYEENPDHYVTAQCVEAARWMAGSVDYPEQLEVVKPYSVKERYYFARGPQLVNRIVDITKHIDTKVESNAVITTQGPGGNAGSRIKKSLDEKGKKLPILGDTDASADANYIKHFVLDKDSLTQRGTPSDREVGKKYGLEWAEAFHYLGNTPSVLPDYIEKNAVSK
ncbi:MAG: PIG-L family deacetylase [Pedobacter sp.]|jgi:LmbE family N-acetylglucosaminyl deacetylase